MSTTHTPPPGWDLERSPFHAGEQAIQERVGVRQKIEAQGRRATRRYLTEQHREFFPKLPQVFVASIDDQGQPWASMLVGRPGFVAVPDEYHLAVAAVPLFGDPLGENLANGAELALLGIELPTRRRNRAIGQAAAVSAAGFTLDVRHTLGVCPQYIQGREATLLADPMSPGPRPIRRAATLDARAREIIAAADTCFVASNAPGEGADISHRGGRPGFVRADDEHTLTMPDFIGNFMFNTLGNFQLDPRAGLLFVDFPAGDMLYIAARAEVIWEGEELVAFTGAQRLVRYHIAEVIRVEGSLPMRYSAPDYSPIVERTGSWEEVAGGLAAARLAQSWRPFRIAEVTPESATIRSFLLEPADGAGVAPHRPGQYLPIRTAAGMRSYTISDAANGRSFRISVKREGSGGVSDWLHDMARPGDVIEAMAPRGSFIFDFEARRPAVLLSAGVGITPMIAMLNAVLVNESRTRLQNRLIFIHGARDGRELAFGEHLRLKAKRHSNLTLHLRFSRPAEADELGRTHHSEGRIDAALLQSLLPLDDYDFYLCGPGGFMQETYDMLLRMGVRDERMHLESFGPASIKRAVAEMAGGTRVRFARSGGEAVWRAGSLLELTERAGVAPLSSCRAGVCGSCVTRVMAGEVDYAEPPAHEIAPGEALICCARPRGEVTLDL